MASTSTRDERVSSGLQLPIRSTPPPGFLTTAVSPVASLYERFSQWRTLFGLPNPGQVEDLQKEVKSNFEHRFSYIPFLNCHHSDTSQPIHFRWSPCRPHQRPLRKTCVSSHPLLRPGFADLTPFIQFWCCLCNRRGRTFFSSALPNLSLLADFPSGGSGP
jgi:hypothetical protein